jgi:5-methylthioadenosine/S-adenosylhomocysteine deaminase
MKIITAEHVLPISSEPLENGAIAIERDAIVAVGTVSDLRDEFPEAKVEDFGEAVLMPGLVNCHSHLEITVMRGFLDDSDDDFAEWLIKLTKTRAENLSEEDIRTSALFGALEGVRAGVTCFGDIGRSGEAGFEALRSNGLRGILFQETEFSPNDATANEDFEKLIEKFEVLRLNETNLVKVGISPHAPYTVSRKLFERISEFAIAKNVEISIHAAESIDEDNFLQFGTGLFAGIFEKFGVRWHAPGKSPVQHLYDIGVLDAKPLLAHCVTVSEQDLSLIKRTGSRIAHCPKSNAKFGHGVAPFASVLDENIPVGFGSDSMGSNNTCDVLEEARFATLLARTRQGKSEFLDAKMIIETATSGGAKALGLQDDIGSLEVGKQADIIAVGLNNVAQIPVHDICSTLLFGTNARDVRMTMVAGEMLYKDGVVTRIDETELKIRMKSIAKKMI